MIYVLELTKQFYRHYCMQSLRQACDVGRAEVILLMNNLKHRAVSWFFLKITQVNGVGTGI